MGAGWGAVAGCVTGAVAGGGGAVFATAAGACGPGTPGAAAVGAACGVLGAGVMVATSSPSESFDLKPFRLMLLRLKLLADRPGAVICRHDSELQPLGCAIWMFCPPTWSEIPLPACAAVLAISSVAA